MTTKEQIKAIIKQYADKGERLFLEVSESNESYAESYWDGYKDCADGLLRELEDVQEEPTTSVWNDARKPPKMYRKYLIRYADGRVNGSWERHKDSFIPWKDVVKEHKFTHWCYVEDLLKL